MYKKAVATCFALILIFTTAGSALSITTGDLHLDALLSNLDIAAKTDAGNFKAKLSLQYSVSEDKIDYLFTQLHMDAGDVYLTLTLAHLAKKPVDTVVHVYQKSQHKGWGAIAKELGIKPGSDEFKQLKAGFGDYDAGNKGKGKGAKKK